MTSKTTITDKPKKILGSSKYAGSKSKVKKQKIETLKVKKIVDAKVSKDRSLKVKIKHLEKELARISKAGAEDKKIAAEKLIIEGKIKKLSVVKTKFQKPKPSKSE